MKALLAAAAVASVLGAAAVPVDAAYYSHQTTITTHASIGHVRVYRCGKHRHWSWRLHRCVVNHHGSMHHGPMY